MTDILLGSNNDLLIEDGKILLINSKEVLTRQRLLNKLRSFTGTLFTNVNYGIDINLIFEKNTQTLLDQNLKTLIADTDGVIRLISFTSQVNAARLYTYTFQYEISTGEIVGVSNLAIDTTGSTSSLIAKGVWKNGFWDYSGSWDNDEIWGI